MSESPPSPLSVPEPWDLVAEAYAAEVVPMFEVFSKNALELVGVGAGTRVVDVAAGPGTLSLLAARAKAEVSALDFSPAMVECLRHRVAQAGLSGVDVTLGDGMALPFADGRFDAGFSMFGLMFFPDRGRGFAELFRVLRPGGRAAVSSWVDLERLPVLAALFGLLGDNMPGPKPPPRPMPLVDPEQGCAEMRAAGFADVVCHEVTGRLSAPSTAEMVASMLRTSAPVVSMRNRLGAQWDPIEAAIHEGMRARFGEGPQQVVMPANVFVGTRPD